MTILVALDALDNAPDYLSSLTLKDFKSEKTFDRNQRVNELEVPLPESRKVTIFRLGGVPNSQYEKKVNTIYVGNTLRVLNYLNF